MTAPIPGPAGVFICYRREDAAFPAAWLYDTLTAHLGTDRVFKDVNSIRPGDDFVERINLAVGSCDVLLAVIGKSWLTVTSAPGRRRLDDPDDYVRLELEAALRRGVHIIPVLIDGSQMPQARELPASLEKLARIQAFELSPHRLTSDASRLLEVMTAALNAAAARRAAESSAVATGSGDRLAAVDDRWGSEEIGPHNRGWLIAAFLLPFSLSGAIVIPFLLYKRDRALLLNAMLSLELLLAAGPGIVCGFLGSKFVGEHASVAVSASFWAAAVILCAPSAAALVYCLMKVGRYSQPEIPWFTRNARRLAAVLGPPPRPSPGRRP